MPRLAIDHDTLRLEIDPSLGAGIAGLWIRRGGPGRGFWPLLRPAPPDAAYFNALSSYFLAPWPNRIAGATLRWHGLTYALSPDWPDGSAIHGCVKDQPWQLVERTPVSATLEFTSSTSTPFPWPFRCAATYRLTPDSLITDLSLHALRGGGGPESPMPAGLGFHPFFMRTLWDPADRVTIRCALAGRYPAREMLPTGPARRDDITAHLAAGLPLGNLALDDVFLGSCDGATITWPASGVRVTLSCSPALGHTVLYTGQPDPKTGAMHPFFCFEPVTMVNNGFNLFDAGWPDTGVASLLPGESLSARWTLRLEGTLA